MIDCSQRCSECSGKFHVIPGDGPSPCRAAMFGQNPGKSEEASACRGEYGQVFVGQAGMELWQHYCQLAGLVRSEDVYVSNVMKCHTENDRKPSPKEIMSCSAHFMPQELDYYRPDIVVLMGAPACSIVPEIWLEAHHGYPRRVELFGVNRWVVPMYHPAAGMHDASVMTPLIQDWNHLHSILGGDFSCPVDKYEYPDYRDLTGQHDLLRYILQGGLTNNWRMNLMARDTEFLQEKKSPIKIPWCVTFTIEPGTGYMIRAVDREGLSILGAYMRHYFSIYHNALADQDVEEAMGLPHVPVEAFHDTMQLAAQQQDLSQKLKALAWRLAGMSMRDYDDVVVPYSRMSVLEWLEEAFDIVSAKRTVKIKYVEKKRKMPKTEKALQKLWAEIGAFNPSEEPDGYFHYKTIKEEECDSELTKKILHIHKHTNKPIPVDSDKPYNPWEAWAEQIVTAKNDETQELKFKPEEIYEITSRIGDMPKVSIEHVFAKNPAEAIRYACRDSDSTRRIQPVLIERSHKYDGKVIAGDIDR